jgi:8-oxo-dGTP diphosphatase
VIEGRRLRLRPFRPIEAMGMARLLNDYDVVRYVGDIPYPYEPAQAAEFIALSRQHLAQGTDRIFAVEGRAEAAIIGCVALHPQAGRTQARLGYWFGRAYWGRGYATETIILALGYAFGLPTMERVEAEAHVDNIGSWRAMEKSGMQFVRSVQLDFRARGFTAAARRYAVTRAEWQALAPSAPHASVQAAPPAVEPDPAVDG